MTRIPPVILCCRVLINTTVCKLERSNLKLYISVLFTIHRFKLYSCVSGMCIMIMIMMIHLSRLIVRPGATQESDPEL